MYITCPQVVTPGVQPRIPTHMVKLLVLLLLAARYTHACTHAHSAAWCDVVCGTSRFTCVCVIARVTHCSLSSRFASVASLHAKHTYTHTPANEPNVRMSVRLHVHTLTDAIRSCVLPISWKSYCTQITHTHTTVRQCTCCATHDAKHLHNTPHLSSCNRLLSVTESYMVQCGMVCSVV